MRLVAESHKEGVYRDSKLLSTWISLSYMNIHVQLNRNSYMATRVQKEGINYANKQGIILKQCVQDQSHGQAAAFGFIQHSPLRSLKEYLETALVKPEP